VVSSRRYVAFDIETAKILPEGVDDIMAHRPLGIACAAAFDLAHGEPTTWCGCGSEGRPAARMSREEAGSLVADLERLVADGCTIVTWNGLAFDFDILAEESGADEACARLALDHVDMMFHVVCSKGHRLGLQKAALGMSLAGKLSGVSGAEAPAMWARGEHAKILEYNVQDVRVTAALAAAGDEARCLRWATQRGSRATMPLPDGWLTVREALDLPLPDTSWMSSPPRREELLGWTRGER
jgi:hypothetical protein